MERFDIGIVGLGLIGGSLALGLREAGFAASVTAWDLDPSVLKQGRELGIIDSTASSLADLTGRADIVALCAPTLACEALLLEALRHPGRARCITDVASVKGPLCSAASALDTQLSARYVPGHPIAGSELSGVAASRKDLFQDHRVILSPLENTDSSALTTARLMWETVGAEVQLMSVTEHDAVLAATSHLPHVLAYALVDALAQSPICDDIFRFAAGGFRDFTRIASSNPVMWRDISVANREALLAVIDDFSQHLGQLRSAVDRSDAAVLEDTFSRAKSARDLFAEKLERRGK